MGKRCVPKLGPKSNPLQADLTSAADPTGTSAAIQR